MLQKHEKTIVLFQENDYLNRLDIFSLLETTFSRLLFDNVCRIVYNICIQRRDITHTKRNSWAPKISVDNLTLNIYYIKTVWKSTKERKLKPQVTTIRLLTQSLNSQKHIIFRKLCAFYVLFLLFFNIIKYRILIV